MADVKTLQTRIALKYDSYSAWTTAPGKDLVLLPGELGICHISDANQGSNVVPTVLFKVGDGNKTFEQLPWASAKAADVYSWAKASDVVYSQENKTITFVKGNVDGSDKVITFNYVTLAEVQAITNGLDARIEALENSVGANGDIGKSVADHESRLDVIEGDGEGSVAKALVDAKAYTDEREIEINAAIAAAEAAAKKDAADELAAAVETLEAADAAIEGRLDVIEGEGEGSVKKALADAKSYADQAEADAIASAKAYTNEREVEINKYADQAEADAVATAKSYTDSEITNAVNTINAKDEAQDTAIGNNATAIADEATARAEADKAINDKIGGNFDSTNTVAKAISDAQSAAISAAATDAAAKVKDLADGQVATNKADIAAIDTAYKAADTALDGRLDDVEAKLADVTNVMDFRGAVEELPAVNNYQNGDVIVVTAGDNKGKEYVLSNGAWVEFGNTDANSAAISSLQTRMTAAEGDIDELEAKDAELANADTALGQRIDALVGENGTIAAGDAATLASAKSYTDDRETAIRSDLKTAYEAYADKSEEDAVATAKSYTDTEIAALEAADEALEGNVKTLQDIVDGYTDKGSIKADVDTKLASADFDSWKTTHEAGHAGTATEITAEITAAVKTETDNRVVAVNAVDAKVSALDTRVGTAEGNITTLQGIVETGTNSNANLRSAITDLQTLTGDAAKGNEALHTELTRVAGLVDNTTTGLAATKAIADKNKTDIGTLNGKVTAIEGDYLKQADLFIINCGSATMVTHTAE